MKTVGILGGMGSYATVDFFRRIVDAFPAEKEWDRPRILIDNNCIMPSRVRAILYHEQVDSLVAQMERSINWLSDSGADIIMMGCMTAHYFIGQMPHQEKLVNVTHLVQSAMQKEKEILVLCTEGSKDAGVWDNALLNVRRVYPNDVQLTELRRFIEIVKTGHVTEMDRREFANYVNKLPSEAVLLGCTELPILANGDLIDKKIYDPIECAIGYLKETV